MDISDEEYQQDLAYLVNHLEDLRLTDAVAAGDVTAAEAQQLTDFVAAVSQAQAENPELRTELENLYAQLANQDINEGTDPVLNTDPAELAAALDESATAATEAPAAPRARRTRQSAARPAAGSIRPTDNIVVPETGFQVADNQYERPEMFDATAPATYGRFEVQDPEAPVYAGYTSSADNQFNPQRFDPRALVAYETERGALRWNRMILKGGEDPRSTYGARRFTEEDAQAIMNAPDNMRFVMTESGSYSQPYTPVLAYDYNRYQAISGVRSNEDGTETNVLQLTRKYASATNRLEDRSASTNPNNYEADSASWRASMLAEEAEFSRMREAAHWCP